MFLILASTVIISRCQFLLFDISQRNDGRKCWNGEKWRGELFWCKKAKAATHMQQTMSLSLHPPALLANPMWNQYWFTDAHYENDELNHCPAGVGLVSE